MSGCARVTGGQIREAAAEIRACDSVIGVDVLDPVESQRDSWTIEITTGLPLGPAVLDRLARHDLAVPVSARRGDDYCTVAVPA